MVKAPAEKVLERQRHVVGPEGDVGPPYDGGPEGDAGPQRDVGPEDDGDYS